MDCRSVSLSGAPIDHNAVSRSHALPWGLVLGRGRRGDGIHAFKTRKRAIDYARTNAAEVVGGRSKTDRPESNSSEYRKAINGAGLSKDQSALEDDASLCVQRSLFGLWRRSRRLLGGVLEPAGRTCSGRSLAGWRSRVGSEVVGMGRQHSRFWAKTLPELLPKEKPRLG